MTIKAWMNEQLKKPYMKNLLARIEKDERNFRVFPPKHLRYYALEVTPYDQLKVVILGQDPYHQEGHANGLAFSCIKKPLRHHLKIFLKRFNSMSLKWMIPTVTYQDMRIKVSFYGIRI